MTDRDKQIEALLVSALKGGMSKQSAVGNRINAALELIREGETEPPADVWNYTAIRGNGDGMSGKVEANTESEALAKIKELGLYVTSVRCVEPNKVQRAGSALDVIVDAVKAIDEGEIL